jgi:acetoin utilization deacetylase AcuC-like enzyme
MPDTTALVFSEYSSGHETGSHPENQSRLEAIEQHLRQRGMLDERPVYFAEPVSEELIAAVHDPGLIELVRELSSRGGGAVDLDTFVAAGSYQAALASAGATLQATDLVLAGNHQRAFSLARPPGHHAERFRQMGFCLFINVAIAASHALESHGLERVAIVDWDVHHGNGTQDIFYESSNVLLCSVHNWPLLPGTGLGEERGIGDGEGFTLNVPLPAGSVDSDYLSVFDHVIGPAVKSFRPELILVSAGFDAHHDDPLAMMSVTAQGFREMTGRIVDWADELTGGQLVLSLEGGYNLRALAESVVSVIEVLDTTAPSERGN